MNSRWTGPPVGGPTRRFGGATRRFGGPSRSSRRGSYFAGEDVPRPALTLAAGHRVDQPEPVQTRDRPVNALGLDAPSVGPDRRCPARIPRTRHWHARRSSPGWPGRAWSTSHRGRRRATRRPGRGPCSSWPATELGRGQFQRAQPRRVVLPPQVGPVDGQVRREVAAGQCRPSRRSRQPVHRNSLSASSAMPAAAHTWSWTM
jgi:hypothetical protein